MADSILIRALLRPAEDEALLDHHAACFAKKGTPRSYFAHHLANDPDCTVFVAVVEQQGEQKIVSSVTIFRRRLHHVASAARGATQCHVVQADLGGVGDVCTNPAFSGRGISSRLLRYVVKWMASSSSSSSSSSNKLRPFHGSFLHAGASLLPFYERFGFETTTSRLEPFEFDSSLWEEATKRSTLAAKGIDRVGSEKTGTVRLRRGRLLLHKAGHGSSSSSEGGSGSSDGGDCDLADMFRLYQDGIDPCPEPASASIAKGGAKEGTSGMAAAGSGGVVLMEGRTGEAGAPGAYWEGWVRSVMTLQGRLWVAEEQGGEDDDEQERDEDNDGNEVEGVAAASEEKIPGGSPAGTTRLAGYVYVHPRGGGLWHVGELALSSWWRNTAHGRQLVSQLVHAAVTDDDPADETVRQLTPLTPKEDSAALRSETMRLAEQRTGAVTEMLQHIAREAAGGGAAGLEKGGDSDSCASAVQQLTEKMRELKIKQQEHERQLAGDKAAAAGAVSLTKSEVAAKTSPVAAVVTPSVHIASALMSKYLSDSWAFGARVQEEKEEEEEQDAPPRPAAYTVDHGWMYQLFEDCPSSVRELVRRYQDGTTSHFVLRGDTF